MKSTAARKHFQFENSVAPMSPPPKRLNRGYSRDKAEALGKLSIDVDATAERGLGYERLDQLLIEHLLGVRGA